MIEAMKAVKLLSVTNTVEAELIMNLLNNNDIPCFKKDHSTGSYMNIYMGYSVFGEDIYVDEADHERALSILNELNKEQEVNHEANTLTGSLDEDEDEDNDASNVAGIYQNPHIIARVILGFMAVGFLLLLLLGYLFR